MGDCKNGPVLQFAPFQGIVDEGFWHRLSSLKLNQLGIDESPITLTGFYAPCSHSQVSNHLILLSESLPSDQSSIPPGNRNRCSIPGILYNTNTLEAFHALDKTSLLKTEATKIWEDIHSGKAEEESAVLSRFLLISFADLKNWKFHYWFAFPALVLDPPATLVSLKPASHCFSPEEAESVTAACKEWRNSSLSADVPFFVVSIDSNSSAAIRDLKDWKNCQSDGHKYLFGFYDPCHLPNNPGWPLRNFIAFLCSRWNLEKILFFCYRENHGFPDLGLSLVGEALVSVSQEWRHRQHIPKAVGWEVNRGKKVSRCITLACSMDPTKLAVSAAELNLKLMRWRALPSLDLSMLSRTKCLLLGAGTLGCQVARMLMAWGVRKITLVDNGKVAMSNPLRQSLYTLEHCLDGGEYKVFAAAKSLKQIFPAVEADGIVMSIPMPGHPVPSQDENNVLEDCRRLKDLIDSHDAVFLLTDTRESRWLPTLLCSNANKITITAALGFDSFLVMRHGAGPQPDLKVESESALSAETRNSSLGDRNERQRLGCYFCSDVVAPIDSTANRTLDQQCTVTRPGLAPIASALAVELLVGILHHPLGIFAQAEFANTIDSGGIEQPLGILPHQIRGSLSQFSQMILVGHSSNSCTACCCTVVSEFRNREMDFVLQAINHPTYLEDITGLTELMKSANSFDLNWDNDTDDDGNGVGKRGRAALVVLGDIGRSPRMQYHALSLARQACLEVDIVGYGGSDPHSAVLEHPSIHIHKMKSLPTISGTLYHMLLPLMLFVKPMVQFVMLLWFLCVKIPAPDVFIVQNPPSVPTLVAVKWASWLRRSKFIVDWHNFGYTLLALSLGRSSLFVAVYRWVEKHYGKMANGSLCVTQAMQLELAQNWGIKATVLYDQPPGFFRSTSLIEKHKLFCRINENLNELYGLRDCISDGKDKHIPNGTPFTTQIGTDITLNQNRPALIVSSTSWTQDEDFSILLEAAVMYDRRVVAILNEDDSIPDDVVIREYREGKQFLYPRLLFIITGKGPEKQMYEEKLRKIKFKRVAFRTMWLSPEDYPLLLGSADLGVCLHTSSSGLDLPMKVVDMFGCGLPVCAVSYSCIKELVKVEKNGLLFSSSSELADELMRLFKGFPDECEALKRLTKGVEETRASVRWETEWEANAKPLITKVMSENF